MAEEKGLAEERKDELALCVEDANTKLTEILNDAVMFAYNKAYAKSLVNQLIQDTTNRLQFLKASWDLIVSTANALKKEFMKQWLVIINILKKTQKEDNLGVIGKLISQMTTNKPLQMQGLEGITIDLIDDKNLGVANARITNLRDYMTDNELGGSQRYTDYVNRLNQALIEVKNNLANGTLTLTDSMGRVKSIRNMAEIETRYKMISEDLKRQGVGQNEFVVGSSHANASLRCSYWQGKIFLVDIDINSRPMGQFDKKHPPSPRVLGHIDGKPYYSLLEACENGFLSFNCQHRLIKYYKGIKPPVYPIKTINGLRDATIKQRQMENTIRHWKRKEKLADDKIQVHHSDTPYIGNNGNWYVNGIDTKIPASTDSMKVKSISRTQTTTTTDYKYNVANVNYWNDKYRDYSKTHGLPRYEWRCRITEYESK